MFATLNEALLSVGPVAQFEGRWFITMGNNGFNLPRNNGEGWATERGALAAWIRCGGEVGRDGRPVNPLARTLEQGTLPVRDPRGFGGCGPAYSGPVQQIEWAQPLTFVSPWAV